MYAPALDRRKTAAALVLLGLAGHAFFLSVSIAGTQIALAVAVLGLLAGGLPRPLRTPLDLPILAFVAVAIASDLLSPYGPPDLAFATLWRAAIGFYVVLHGLRTLPEGASRQLLGWAAAGLALASAVGLVQYRTGVDVLHLLHLRAQPAWVAAPGVEGRFGAMGFFTSRLTFGHVATVLIALLGGALAEHRLSRRTGLLAAGALLLAFPAVALTFDRGAWLGLCAAVAVLALLSGIVARRALLAVALALAVGVAAVPGLRGRFASGFSSRANSDRVFIWSRSAEIIRDHPVLGIGWGNYPRVCGGYYDRVDPAFVMRTWAHNLELSTLAETGPLGLLAMLCTWGTALVALWRKRAAAGLAALAAWLAIAQAHDVIYDTKVMYALWFALALALSGSRGSPPARAA